MSLITKWIPPLVAGLVLAACGGEEAADAAAPAARAEAAAPSAGDRELAALTAGWTAEQREACGRELEETLGTRDLVEGALAAVADPQGRAAAELEDAKHWKAAGDSTLAALRPRLRAGACDGGVQVGLDEAVQAYVKAGTSAVQAGQIAGS
ncbi:MAG TPA: hypothetical protein VFQ76_20910 [Longimicrobiaceae bacterium]|nr:hypothetical protein [Longimicrobiaceae bacterium]